MSRGQEWGREGKMAFVRGARKEGREMWKTCFTLGTASKYKTLSVSVILLDHPGQCYFLEWAATFQGLRLWSFCFFHITFQVRNFQLEKPGMYQETFHMLPMCSATHLQLV